MTTTAFERFVRQNQTKALRVALRLTFGDIDAAKDAVQEAFLKLWRGRESLKDTNLEGYLMRAVLSCARDAARRTRAVVALDESLPVVPVSNTASAVQAALATLSENHREVVILAHYEGWTHAEIAALLQIPPGTVASRLHHALRHLKALLLENPDD